MTLRNLLVHLDTTAATDKRAEAAVALAAEHGAHLAALTCIGEILLPGWAQMPPEVLDQQRRLQEDSADSILAAFREKAERAGISYETRCTRVPANEIGREVALHTRYCDLAVLGQIDPDEAPAGGRQVVEQVALDSGRPVLVIPYIGAPERDGAVGFGREVMVAWDAGREAARAVNDALPILARAASTRLVVINPEAGGQRHGQEPGADIGLHLARHDIEVDVQTYDMPDLGPGEALLARVADAGCDLLVMGAYGHSRVRELVLGGATRTVLQHMTVPVLLSH